MSEQWKKLKFKIHGTHCSACEVLIERKFKNIDGVEKVSVNHADGRAVVYCSRQPDLEVLNQAVKDDGYTVSWWQEQTPAKSAPVTGSRGRDYLQIGGIFLALMIVYVILKRFDLIPKGLTVADNMSYGLAFMIGLVAAVSTCIAVTGGLLLAVAAKYNERHANMSGRQKFKPHIYFNLGRVASYTVFGGLLGAVGSIFTFSPRATGFLTIIASLVMIILGFQLLKLFPGLQKFHPKMPKFLAHRVHDIATKDSKAAPFFLGAGTFFLPCGFTQALQLYVLSQGEAVNGALIMMFFALGTLPALLSLSAISSFARGNFQRHFLKVSGVLVIMVGLFSLNGGLNLVGSPLSFSGLWAAFETRPRAVAQAGQDPNVEVVNGRQIVRMKVVGYDYYPSRFTIQQGLPVDWIIDGSQAAGCAQVITSPKLNITKFLPRQGTATVSFTPQSIGTFGFSCTMGMTTPGAAFVVVAKESAGGTAVPAVDTQQQLPASPLNCDPEYAICLGPQKVSIEITTEKGFYPKSVTVKKNLPVELTLDAKVPLRGCMSVMMVSEYNALTRMQLGKNVLAFTPTKAGTLPVTCSMGSRMAQVVVTD